jgi:hypothetical protein
MRLFALLALLATGCVPVPTQPPVLLDAVHHTVFERYRLPRLMCPDYMLPVCESLGRTGPIDCYCVP